MPRIYIEPAQFIHYRGVTIYHTYRNEDGNYPMSFHYRTDEEEDNKFVFDVRDLPNKNGFDVSKEEDQKLIIKNAIDEHLLLLPEGVLYTPEDTGETKQEEMMDKEFQIPLSLRRRDIAQIFGNDFALDLEAREITGIADRMSVGFKKWHSWDAVLCEAMNLPDLISKIEALRSKAQ